MIVQSVTPDNGDKEGKWIALIIGTILLVAAFSLPFHQAESNEVSLEPHQVLVTDLTQDNLAMIAELRLAYEEIVDIYAESLDENSAGIWPNVASLSDDWLPPFVKDQSWKRRGMHEWRLLNDGLYLGLKSQESGAASFILNAQGSEIQLWLHPTLLQRSSFNESALLHKHELINSGWQHIVFPSHDDASSHDEHS